MANYFDQFDEPKKANYFDQFDDSGASQKSPLTNAAEFASNVVDTAFKTPPGPFQASDLESMLQDNEWAKQNIEALPQDKRQAGVEQIKAAIEQKKYRDDTISAYDKANTGYAKDIALSLPSGVARGIAGLASLPNLIERGGRWAVGNEGKAVTPKYEDLVGTEEWLLGTKLYEPKTVPGEYANTFGEFLPSVAGGGAGTIGKFAALPAVASETAGQITKGSQYEPYARLGAAVASPFTPAMGRAIGKGARRAVGVPDEWLNPEATALGKVQEALAQDVRATADLNAGMKPMSEQAMLAAQLRGQPIVNLDVGGDALRRLGRSAANQSPEAASRLRGAVQDRFDTQAHRLDEALVKASGSGGDAAKARDALQAEARKSRKPLYDTAFSEGAGGIESEIIGELRSSPSFKKAMGEATTRMKDRQAAASAGGDATTGIFGEIKDSFPVYDENGKITKYVDSAGKDISELPRTLEYWDTVKVSLDDDIQASLNRGANGRARELIMLRDKLVEGLDESVGSYAAARGNAARIFGTSDALSAGEKFASPSGSYSNPEVKRAIAEMTDAERTAFREGYTSRLRQQMQEIGDNQNLAGRLLNSPATRERMELALGKLGTKEFREFLANERRMQLSHGAITGGSQTAQFQKDLLRLAAPYAGGGAAGYFASGGDWKGAIGGASVIGLRNRLAASLLESGAIKTADELSKILTSKDPKVLRNAVSNKISPVAKENVASDLQNVVNSAVSGTGLSGARNLADIILRRTRGIGGKSKNKKILPDSLKSPARSGFSSIPSLQGTESEKERIARLLRRYGG